MLFVEKSVVFKIRFDTVGKELTVKLIHVVFKLLEVSFTQIVKLNIPLPGLIVVLTQLEIVVFVAPSSVVYQQVLKAVSSAVVKFSWIGVSVVLV